MDIYKIAKLILTIIYIAGFAVGIISFFRWIFLFASRNPDKGKRVKSAKILLGSFVVVAVALVAHLVISVKQYGQPIDINKIPTFTVTSDNLHDGVWDEKIGAKHGNVSPQLSWDKVENAEKYAVVMIDYDGNNWLHWMYLTNDIGLDEGAVTDKDGYVGPYPPSGTHKYTVYVFALKGDTYSIDYNLDSGGTDFQKLTEQINSGVETDYNNIIAVGVIEGEYGER